MKALSVLHPGGSRIASGEKTIEVRGWAPDLADGEDLVIVENHQHLRRDGDEDLNGRIVAIVKVRAVRPFITADMASSCALVYEDGKLAWELTDIRTVRPPRGPVIAKRGMYDLDMSLEEILSPCRGLRRTA